MTVAPMSCVASATIMFMILRSKKKLKDPYRRIIFCMSMYDIFSSLPVALRPFKVLLTSSGHSSLALGTQASCDLLTYIQIVGVVGTPMYSLSLNIYYLFVIKYSMRERHFRRKVEPFIHIIPALWTLGGATFALFSKMFNPGASGGCFLASKPLGCQKNDDIECERGENAPRFFLFFGAIPISLCFLGIFYTLLKIYCTIRSQETLMNKYRIRRVSYKLTTKVTDPSSSFTGNTENILARRKPKKIKSKGRGFLRLAYLYVLGFMVTYTFAYVVQFMTIAGRKPTFTILLLDRLFQPCQGVCNIFIYTSTYVKVYRENNPDLSWFQSFLNVIRKGGDDDMDVSARRSASTRRMSVRSLGQSHQSRRRSSLYARNVLLSSRSNRGDTIPVHHSNVEIIALKARRLSQVHFDVNCAKNEIVDRTNVEPLSSPTSCALESTDEQVVKDNKSLEEARKKQTTPPS